MYQCHRNPPSAGPLLLVLFGLGLSAGPGPAGELRRAAPVPKPARPGRILIWVDEKPLLISPEGAELPSPDAIPKAHMGVGNGTAQLSPDGTRVAFHKQGAAARMPVPAALPAGVAVGTRRTTLQILDLDGTNGVKALESVHLNHSQWLGDGKTLYVRGQEIGEGDVVSEKVGNWVYDPATGKKTPLPVPAGFVVRAVGPDGRTAVADEWNMSPMLWHQHTHLWTIGTDKPAPLLELNESSESPTPRFSPDGRRLLCKVQLYGTHKPLGNGAFEFDDFKSNKVVVIDPATKRRTVVKNLGENPEWRVGGLAWSPDGRKIAYVEAKRQPQQPRQPPQTSYRVIVADPDGGNAKPIYSAEGSWLVGFDWK